MLPKINTHNGHNASCLCCDNLYCTNGSQAYSEYTPGDPPEVSCSEGHQMPDYETDLEGLMQFLHDQGLYCPDFAPKS